MRIVYTDEMNRLRKIYEPYLDGTDLTENAPKEAIEAKRKFKELFRIEKEKNRNFDLL